MSVVDYQETINNLLIFHVCIWYLLRHEKKIGGKLQAKQDDRLDIQKIDKVLIK